MFQRWFQTVCPWIVRLVHETSFHESSTVCLLACPRNVFSANWQVCILSCPRIIYLRIGMSMKSSVTIGIWASQPSHISVIDFVIMKRLLFKRMWLFANWKKRNSCMCFVHYRFLDRGGKMIRKKINSLADVRCYCHIREVIEFAHKFTA